MFPSGYFKLLVFISFLFSNLVQSQLSLCFQAVKTQFNLELRAVQGTLKPETQYFPTDKHLTIRGNFNYVKFRK